MSSLQRWLEIQRHKLGLSLWLELSLCVARLDTLIKRESFTAAEHLLPEVYGLIAQHGLADWRVFVQLMESSLALVAGGNLKQVMDIAMQALTTAEKLPGAHDHALRLGARLMLIRCWLKTDDVGYAADALAVGEESLSQNNAGDWRFWFLASNAWALWAMKRQEEANALLRVLLADLPRWASTADEIEGRGYIAYRMQRQAESAQYYREAAARFEAEGLVYGATRCQLNRALCLYETGDHDESMRLLEQTLPRTLRLTNPHYQSLAYCFRGRNFLATQDYERADDDLGRALAFFEGRGWLRDQAQIAIERLEAMKAMGNHPEWEQVAGKARRHVARLRSTDLQPRLAMVLGEQ